MPIVRNISEQHNIIINEKAVTPSKTANVSEEQLEDLQGLIDQGMLEIVSTNKVEVKAEQNSEISELKQRILPALFSLHLDLEVTDKELSDLKWFFKNAGPTSQLDSSIKNLLDDVKNHEEFLEVLLNNIYPELIDRSLK